ncbi:MAG: hypothetical protein U1E29_12200 [Coriobacteriia bacterium]|nr:hypothetical protein [Coriobacteriia bacterium]
MRTVVVVAKGIGIVVAGLFGLIVLGLLLVPPATRWYTDSWGATEAETLSTLPGDDLFPAQREISTKALTIDAPPDVVYALLKQMGQHRGGWYGWDWFYNATGSSDFVDGHYSKRIVPELQDLGVGDEIAINDMVSYEVLRADTDRVLILGTGTHKLDELGDPGPETWSYNTMAWVISETDSGGTRLVLRMRADGSESGFGRWVWNGPMNFGGALFSRKTMVGIKRTAEEIID